MPHLFDPFTLKGSTLRNRIAASPMCMYSAEDGLANDWHAVHLPGLARGGAGLVMVEATAVTPEGRITPGCLGLWNDAQAQALAPIVRNIQAAGAAAGIQIGHAGRKASANRPWEGDDHIPEGDPRGWTTLAPSAIAFGANLPRVPQAMTLEDIARVQQGFVAAAIRARDAGFDWLMLHLAHGYLAQEFLYRGSNTRTDQYGGSAENRARFLLETIAAVRAVWPEDRPLIARLGVIEFDGNDDQDMAEAIALLTQAKAKGLDLVDVSIGFSTPTAQIPWKNGTLTAPYAARVRAETGLPVATSWNIGTAENADALIRESKIDLAMLGRPLLANPHWPYAAAKALGVERPSWVLPAPYAHWLQRYA